MTLREVKDSRSQDGELEAELGKKPKAIYLEMERLLGRR